ncbi:DUF4783 domain-containing protein [Bacteroidota bacterium]
MKHHREIIKQFVFYFLTIFIVGSTILRSQIKPQKNNLLELVENFESGMRTGDIDEFAKYLNSELYLSLSNSIESGYYSANQSYYLIQNYFNISSPMDFNVDRINTKSKSPYLIGEMNYYNEGIKKKSTVYVSFFEDRSGWKISQISID